MSFDEVRLPIEIERGALGGPGFLTTVVVLASGKERRNQLWEVDRGEWDIGFGIDDRAGLLAVRDFFMARRGRARGFRFRDWTNYETGSTPQGMEETPDSGDTTFGLTYTYMDDGMFTYTKRIFKPVATGFALYRDSVLVPTNEYSLDTTTGIVTFNDPPDYGVDITWTGQFDLPVRFDVDRIELEVTTKNAITAPSLRVVELKL